MASFPFLLQAQSGSHQVQLSYNGQHLEFDQPEHEESGKQSGCLPCGPAATTGRSIRTVEILNVTFEAEHTLVVAACWEKHGPKKESELEFFKFQVKDTELAKQWQSNVLSHVYKDVKQGRHYKVLVNPFGGQGHAQRIWQHTAEPLFKASGSTYDLTLTTHRYHAKEIAKELDIRKYDAVCSISGDGVLHEVINGFMERPDAVLAHKLPLGAIPGGSGNALSYSLLGEDHGSHSSNAVLAILKGRAMPVDLCSVTQAKTRTFSFVLQSFGLIADVDLGSEHLRWMGGARFTVSALGKVLSQSTAGCELAYLPVESDVQKIHSQYNAQRTQPVVWADQTHDEMDENHKTIVDVYGGVQTPLNVSDGWVVEKGEFATVVGAKLPWISKGSVTHPAAQPNDGLIDLLIFPSNMGRVAGLQALVASENGEHIHNEKVRYLKVKAFRVTPTASSGYLSLDGEHTPYEPYQVEAHRGLISVLSVEGRYARSMRE